MKKFFFKETEKTEQAAEEPEWHLTRPQQQIKIAVTGISRGAGATYAAVTLAFLLSQSKNVEKGSISVTYAEMRKPEPGETMVYFSAGLDRRFRDGTFKDFFNGQDAEPCEKHAVRAAGLRPLNLHKGINWAVHREYRGLQTPQHTLPSDPLPGHYLIADSPPMETLHQYDLVLGVIDPLPSAVYAGAALYEELCGRKESGLHLIWILNKDCPQVNHSALNRFLGLQEYVPLQLVNPSVFCEAEYAGRLPAEILLEEEKNTPGMEPGALENFKNVIMQQLLQR